MPENGNVERRTILKAAGASAAALGLAATTGCGGDSGAGDGTVTTPLCVVGWRDRAPSPSRRRSRSSRRSTRRSRIKPEFTDYAAFWEKFQTQASGGNPPDVFQNAVGFLRKYDKRGVLMDLKTQADAGNLSLENFRNGVLANGQVDGKQLGIPVGANTMALVIDLKAFKKAGVEPKFGWTWDEYFAALQTIQDKLKIAGDTGYFSHHVPLRPVPASERQGLLHRQPISASPRTI